MKKLILFAMSLFAVNTVWAQQPSTAAPVSSVETVNSDSVPVEEYVPKVIIEGKWGTGPGEFGYDGFYLEGFVPKNALFTPDDFIYPRSLAVDSKGNIYVLDVANNRIQKFNAAGKHLTELKIDSWSGYKKSQDGDDGYVYVIKGIRIVIDSKNNLYYYLQRVKDGKEMDEVWKFNGDVLMSKTPQAVPETVPIATLGSIDDEIASDVNVAVDGSYTAVEKKKKRNITFRLFGNEKIYGKKKAVYNERYGEWKIRVKNNGKVWIFTYNRGGQLVKKSEVPLLSEFIDSKGNYYFIDVNPKGVMVRKSEVSRR